MDNSPACRARQGAADGAREGLRAKLLCQQGHGSAIRDTRTRRAQRKRREKLSCAPAHHRPRDHTRWICKEEDRVPPVVAAGESERGARPVGGGVQSCPPESGTLTGATDRQQAESGAVPCGGGTGRLFQGERTEGRSPGSLRPEWKRERARH